MLLWVGVVCSVVGNLLNGVSFQVQRYAHVHNERNVSYLKLPLWWAGLVCMVSGETGNFIAYGVAPASLVAPIGAIAVILNAMLSHLVLREAGSCKSYAGGRLRTERNDPCHTERTYQTDEQRRFSDLQRRGVVAGACVFAGIGRGRCVYGQPVQRRLCRGPCQTACGVLYFRVLLGRRCVGRQCQSGFDCPIASRRRG